MIVRGTLTPTASAVGPCALTGSDIDFDLAVVESHFFVHKPLDSVDVIEDSLDENCLRPPAIGSCCKKPIYRILGRCSLFVLSEFAHVGYDHVAW